MKLKWDSRALGWGLELWDSYRSCKMYQIPAKLWDGTWELWSLGLAMAWVLGLISWDSDEPGKYYMAYLIGMALESCGIGLPPPTWTAVTCKIGLSHREMHTVQEFYCTCSPPHSSSGPSNSCPGPFSHVHPAVHQHHRPFHSYPAKAPAHSSLAPANYRT